MARLVLNGDAVRFIGIRSSATLVLHAYCRCGDNRQSHAAKGGAKGRLALPDEF
jgi:hypothetical protein